MSIPVCILNDKEHFQQCVHFCRHLSTINTTINPFLGVFPYYDAHKMGYPYRSTPSSFSHEIHPGPLVRALFRWGAVGALDVFDWNGQRPLHLAVLLVDLQVSRKH